jgi:hypothetical protein
MSHKTIVVFSTRDIGVADCLFNDLKSREWFKSPKLCGFFLDRLDDTPKGSEPSDKQKVCKEMGIADNLVLKREFLAKNGIDLEPPNIRMIKRQIKNKGDKVLEEYEYLWNDYIPKSFTKQLQYLNYDSPSISKELLDRNLNLKCEIQGPLFLFRFSLYKPKEGSDVFAVWPLDIMCEKPETAESWYDALSDEILCRYKDYEGTLEINLILHDKDIYPKKSFDIERVGEKCVIDGRSFIRNIAVFQHQKGEDPVASILNKPGLSASQAIVEICKLISLKPLKELSEMNISFSPDPESFKEKLEQVSNANFWEPGTLYTIEKMNDILKSILAPSDNGRQ